MSDTRLTPSQRLLCALPFLAALFVWLTPLAFFPVPWPDDSAFYFAAKDLFAWPPRWVMIPQAPFEPTYRTWNFNTMPLFPVLIGLLRMIGIDGSFALKILPLGAYAATVSLLSLLLIRLRAPVLLTAAITVFACFDPILHWGSVIVRPESLIGLFALCIVYGETLGYPERFRESRFFHPTAGLLALAAYSHFNAIYLVPLATIFWLHRPRKLFKIGGLTFAYLIPWLATGIWHFWIFIGQMQLQFRRLVLFRNPWLDSWKETMSALLPEMGTPEPWTEAVRFTAPALVLLIIAGLVLPLALAGIRLLRRREDGPSPVPMLAASAWLASSLLLWHQKAEVWFVYYIHLSLVTTWALLLTWYAGTWPRLRRLTVAVTIPFYILAGAYAYSRGESALRLSATETWHWSTYREYIDCIDRHLTAESARYGNPPGFKVWAPTFPDILIELSLRHPTWEFTRTNDFHERNHQAIRHGYLVPAMVVPETFHRTEENYDGEAAKRPDLTSVWMEWDGYYLHKFLKDPSFKPRRYVCKRARWEAYLYFME